MSTNYAPIRRWVGLVVGLALLAPVLFYAAFVFGMGFAMVGGVLAGAGAEIGLVVAAGVLVWCWSPELRNPPRRVVTAVMICLPLALGGVFLMDILYTFSDPAWRSF